MRRIWADGDARARDIYLAAAAIGLVVCVWVYGPSHIIGTSAYWEMPEVDERMATMGYRYFLAHAWHWPVFQSDAVNVPYSKSLAYLDVIPIWALINKAIATIVPPWRSFSAHAYLGLWHALSYAMQACFGLAIMRALGHKSWRAGIMSALFFLAVPTWIFRYSHPGLQAHWIELWALYLYFVTPERVAGTRRLGMAKVAQLIVAALTSPYHPVLSLPVFIASLIRTRDRRTIAIWLPIGVAAVVAATWFGGYLASEGVRAQWGFSDESANLLSWLVPLRSGILGDARWIANVDATGYQYEGYAYLGLGYLVLLAMFVWRAPAAIKKHRYLFAFVLGFCVLAMSNRIYFGSHQLASYPIPSFLKWIPGQFRSPGRFVWIPTYVLIAFLLHRAFSRFSTPRGKLVLAALLVLQLVDVKGEWSFQRWWTTPPRRVLAQHDQWRELVHAHEAVFTVPAFSCSSGESRGQLDFVAMEIQWFASERALPINGTYATRVRRKCAAELRDWATAAMKPGAIYFLFPDGAAVADRFQSQGATCGAFDYGRVCSMNRGAIDDAIRAQLLQPITLR